MTIDDSVKNSKGFSEEKLRKLAERARNAAMPASDEANQTAPRESLREFLAKQDYSELRRLLAPYVGQLQAMAERAHAAANANYSQ